MPESLPPPDTSFADLLGSRERGKLKIYVGSAAGSGKTFRMLTEAHQLRQRGVDVVVGYIETHGRIETEAQVRDLEVEPRRRVEYRGVTLEEMDVAAIVERAPAVALVDELAHTNVPGTGRAKRWQDVIALLDAGISVISAVNVQHLESLNDVIQQTLGVTVRETVPDWVVTLADQVVNLDISAEDLRQRLLEGRIYPADRIPTALTSFFTEENLATLRELALREVASSVDRARAGLVSRGETLVAGTARSDRRAVDRVLVGMSSHPEYTAVLLRKASRIAGRLNPDWYGVYVQTSDESATRIDATLQRKLGENIQRAQVLGAEVATVVADDVAGALLRFAREHDVTLIIVGQSQRRWWQRLWRSTVTGELTRNVQGIDVLVVPLERNGTASKPSPAAVVTLAERSETTASAPAIALASVEQGTIEPAAAAAGIGEYAALLVETVATVRHQLDEVRTALHIVLERHFGALNESQEEMLSAARAATEGVAVELERLETIARIDRGTAQLRRDPVRVADLLGALRTQLEADGARIGVTVSFDILPGLPRVLGDRPRLQYALELLLRHMVRHAVPGSTVVVSAAAATGSVVVSVAGAAVPTLDADVVLARRIIEAQSGRIAVTDGGAAIVFPAAPVGSRYASP